MKQLKNLFLATALCIVTVSFTQAQSKIAHINTQELIAAMPEAKAAQTEIETLGKTYQTDIQASITEYQNTVKQYEAEAATKTDEENQKRGLELQEKQQRIQQFRSDAQQDIAKKEAELFKPIQEKAMKAIQEVAKAQGYQYVLDRASVIVADGKDILADVKKKMGI
ncbi:OmpH family outer membrane protein [Tamlana sp. 2_MG-2023]|uniref:OmpH family outer membrane protein n=1 Tax=unclassified Tamlana TaxID=2614803 RepID=UPI0026E39E8F|nr:MULTISPECIES: OmpH family outer membrane protein [unclassified Tamlana]MDO6761013.1 OmpH family outer membrane protein [Tamlana sp. 2_MG-2023]MDO6791654.1 OmpH family outer membrane protein [Tamlana sp. 1_MG-2023]